MIRGEGLSHDNEVWLYSLSLIMNLCLLWLLQIPQALETGIGSPSDTHIKSFECKCEAVPTPGLGMLTLKMTRLSDNCGIKAQQNSPRQGNLRAVIKRFQLLHHFILSLFTRTRGYLALRSGNQGKRSQNNCTLFIIINLTTQSDPKTKQMTHLITQDHIESWFPPLYNPPFLSQLVLVWWAIWE